MKMRDEMNDFKSEKYAPIQCSSTITLMECLKLMDQRRRKLFLVFSENEYAGMISIGDIQRAIINNIPLTSPVAAVIKKDQIVAYSDDPKEEVLQLMQTIRSEFMPIIERISGSLEDVLFWDEMFPQTKLQKRHTPLSLPVVIMAGGKGSRLKPITNILPKALIPIGEKTIMETIMDRFVATGCSEFHISVNYRAEMIRQYFNTLNNDDYQISYFTENKPLGTAGSLFLLRNTISTTFFVTNCDIIIEQDFQEIYKYHHSNNNEITLVAAIKNYHIPYGTVVSGENGLLTEMSEKPELAFLINSGLYILEPHLLQEIPENTFFHITELIDKVKTRGGRVGVFPVSEGAWVDIGEWPEYVKTVRGLFGHDSDHFKGIK